MAKNIKHFIMVCGPSRSGKDTFVSMAQQYLTLTGTGKAYDNSANISERISSIDRVAKMLKDSYCIGRVSSEDRKILADVKTALEQNDFIVSRDCLVDAINYFKNGTAFVFIQVREPESMDWFKKHIQECNNEYYQKLDFMIQPITLKILSTWAIENCPENHADQASINYDADYNIINDGTLADLFKEACVLIDTVQKTGRLLY